MKFSLVCGSIRSNVSISKYLLLLLVSGIIILSPACSSHPKGPPREGVLRESRMVALLVDLHYFEGIYTVTGGSTGYWADKSADSLDFYHEVFASHGTGREEFKKSLEYYSYNPEQFEQLYNRVVDELSKRLTEAEMEEPEVPETTLSPAGVPARQ